jgi:membrane complex biogenesis BtpA family protein
MEWIKDIFGVEKPIIAMCHFRALPGDPDYDPAQGIEWVLEQARFDLLALQKGGVDGVLFSNESSLPYLTKVESITPITMGRLIGELRREITVPFGVNVLWDPMATVELAVATGAQFVREIFTGLYASDFGLWNTDCGAVIRRRNALHGQDIRLIFNILPESSAYIGQRTIQDIARSTVFNTRPDAICVSGLMAGEETSTSILQKVKQVVTDTPVIANTGVRLSNVNQQLAIADGAIVGTTFKEDGYIWNSIDPQRVSEFMTAVRKLRSS